MKARPVDEQFADILARRSPGRRRKILLASLLSAMCVAAATGPFVWGGNRSSHLDAESRREAMIRARGQRLRTLATAERVYIGDRIDLLRDVMLRDPSLREHVQGLLDRLQAQISEGEK